MERRIYNNEARRDPEKLREVQHDLLEAAAIGDIMIDLAAQLAAAAAKLRPGIVPGPQEKQMEDVKRKINALQWELDSTFVGMCESAVNLTYLGNLAADRYGTTVWE